MFDVKISPSRLAYLEACPVFWQSPQEFKSEAAEEGDLLHEAVEKNDPSLLDDEEQRKSVSECLNYVSHLSPHAVDDPRSGVPMVQRDRVFKEQWLNSDIGKRGRADLLILPAADPGLAHVVDYKFGKEPVEHAATNPQGVDYAYRVFLNYPEVSRVRVHFIMPRQNDITWHEFSREVDEPLMRKRILEVHERVNDPFKLPTPNLDKACRYCDLKSKCPALANSAVELSRRYQLLPVPEDFAPQAPRTPEERGLAQDLADLLIKWGEDVKKQNTRSVLDGAEAEGYKVQSRRGNVTVEQPEAFIAEFADKHGFNQHELLSSCCTVSFAKAVALLKSRSDLTLPDLKREVETEFGHLLSTNPDIVYLSRERKGKRKEEKQQAIKNKKQNMQLLEEVTKLKQEIGD